MQISPRPEQRRSTTYPAAFNLQRDTGGDGSNIHILPPLPGQRQMPTNEVLLEHPIHAQRPLNYKHITPVSPVKYSILDQPDTGVTSLAQSQPSYSPSAQPPGPVVLTLDAHHRPHNHHFLRENIVSNLHRKSIADTTPPTTVDGITYPQKFTNEISKLSLATPNQTQMQPSNTNKKPNSGSSTSSSASTLPMTAHSTSTFMPTLPTQPHPTPTTTKVTRARTPTSPYAPLSDATPIISTPILHNNAMTTSTSQSPTQVPGKPKKTISKIRLLPPTDPALQQPQNESGILPQNNGERSKFRINLKPFSILDDSNSNNKGKRLTTKDIPIKRERKCPDITVVNSIEKEKATGHLGRSKSQSTKTSAGGSSRKRQRRSQVEDLLQVANPKERAITTPTVKPTQKMKETPLKQDGAIKYGPALNKQNNDSHRIREKFVTLKLDKMKLQNLISPSTSSHSEVEVQVLDALPQRLPTTVKTVRLTSSQISEIARNNKDCDDKKNGNGNDTNNVNDCEKISLPTIMKLSGGKGVPSIPEKYVPLMMAPNGKLVPLEIIDIDENGAGSENGGKISILKPVWPSLSIPDDDESDVVNCTDIGEEHVDVKFGTDEQLAALNLYLLSQERALTAGIGGVSDHDRVRSELPLYREHVNYYNRLLEREELEIFDTYTYERNKLQNMLNDLESGNEMTTFEEDLLEMRDYQILRENLAFRYSESETYLQYLEYISELESMACLDYTARLTKLKNYLNMESRRLNSKRNRLCKIKTIKSHSIWNRYVKSGAYSPKQRGASKNGESEIHDLARCIFDTELVSQRDFMLLTNANSRTYGTYVLNNSVNKGNENQGEIVRLVEEYLPEHCTLRELYREIDKQVSEGLFFKEGNDKRLLSVNGEKHKGMASAYGLKESNISHGNRLLKELQIDGMNVDIKNGEREERVERRGVGQRRSTRVGGSGGVVIEDGNVSGSGINSKTETQQTQTYTRGNNRRDTRSSQEDQRDEKQKRKADMDGNANHRRELNITSVLDKTLCDVDRVKSLNLNVHEIGVAYTKTYGMPQGLHRDEADSDLRTLRASTSQ